MRVRGLRRGGFTLIELLVVIGIIAVLAAIIMPVYSGAQEKARQSACLSNLAGITVALKLYRQEHRRYPLGSLTGNATGLADDAGNVAYVDAAYNTYDDVSGRKSRINALFPDYIETHKDLLCPDENGDTDLIADEDTAGAYNGGDSTTLLSVDDATDPYFAASTYDDYYNVFGYADGDTATVTLGLGTPITTLTTSGGRKAPRLSNPYAPGSAIITYCREHEDFYKGDSVIVLAARVGGRTERISRKQFQWSAQVEQAYE